MRDQQVLYLKVEPLLILSVPEKQRNPISLTHTKRDVLPLPEPGNRNGRDSSQLPSRRKPGRGSNRCLKLIFTAIVKTAFAELVLSKPLLTILKEKNSSSIQSERPLNWFKFADLKV
jgi:hypothetical protein